MIPFGLTPPLSFFWGYWLSNKYPQHRRIYFIAISLLTLIANILIFLLPNTTSPSTGHYLITILSLFLISLAFAGFCTLIIPCVSLIVPEYAMGTAFGASGMATSLSQAVMPVLNALVIGEGDGEELAVNYHRLSLVYLGFSVAAVGLAVGMRMLRNNTMRAVDKLEKLEGDRRSISSRSFSGFEEDITIHLNDGNVN
jgi:MFS family permease